MTIRGNARCRSYSDGVRVHRWLQSATLAVLVAVSAPACRGDSRSTDGLKAGAGTTGASTVAKSVDVADGVTTTQPAGARAPTTGAGANVGGPPTSLPAIPFRVPATGTYQYHERVQPQSGDPSERTVRYELSAVKRKPGVIRWDEADPVTGQVGKAGDHFEEIHDREGLFLLASIVGGTDECRWSPRSVLLPRAVIQGGEIETTSTCTVPIEGTPTELTLTTKLKFLRTHDLAVAGATRPAIDVSRVRVLSGDSKGPFTITSRAVDTFAFDLGVRVRTEDHSSNKRPGKPADESTRILTLTATP